MRRSIAASISAASRAGRTVTVRRQSEVKPAYSAATKTAAGSSAPRALTQLREGVHQLDREREDDRRVLVDAHLEQSLQVAQLKGGRVLGDDLGSLRELLGGLILALGVDDLGAP